MRLDLVTLTSSVYADIAPPATRRDMTDHVQPSVLSWPSPSSIQLLGLLPTPLLALVASHLSSAPLLRLQRCSSALRRLRADDSYMAVAWCNAELTLCTSSPQCRSFSFQARIVSPHSTPIPVHEWEVVQLELATLFAASEARETDEARRNGLRGAGTWLSLPRPTHYIRVKRDGSGTLREVDDVGDEAEGEERVEVLRDYDWAIVNGCLQGHRRVDDYCRVALRACPYVRQLRVEVDSVQHMVLSNDDTFALTPRLLSLHLCHAADRASEVQADRLPIDFGLMFDSLPCLTSLRCDHIRIDIDDLLNIACHSTLEQVRIEATGKQVRDAQWIGTTIRLPCDEATDRLELEQSADGEVLDGDVAEEERKESALYSALLRGQLARDQPELEELRRMHAALTRTQPSQRSCDARLAVADWLHRRFKRAGLYVNTVTYQESMWCDRVALIRCTLRQQLSELSAVNTAVND